MPTPTRTIIFLSALPLIWQALPAQTLASRINKPPAGVEEALRERVSSFFTLQSEGKFRQAESLVCEDSKDAYYDSFKSKWTSVSIKSITWEDSFQTGKVLMSLGTEMKTLGGTIPANLPLAAIWKAQNNNWCYFVPPVDATQSPSPFGTMTPGPAAKDGDLAMNRKAPPTSSDVGRLVGFTKLELHVRADEESTDSLEVLNGLPGSLRLEVHAPDFPGLKWTLSKTELQERERAVLTVVYKPVDKSRKAPFNLNLVVEPFGGIKAIPVFFESPAVVPSPIALPTQKP